MYMLSKATGWMCEARRLTGQAVGVYINNVEGRLRAEELERRSIRFIRVHL